MLFWPNVSSVEDERIQSNVKDYVAFLHSNICGQFYSIFLLAIRTFWKEVEYVGILQRLEENQIRREPCGHDIFWQFIQMLPQSL